MAQTAAWTVKSSDQHDVGFDASARFWVYPGEQPLGAVGTVMTSKCGAEDSLEWTDEPVSKYGSSE